MSRFSGKCDLYDWFYDSDETKMIKNIKATTFVINDTEYYFGTIKEIVPYYSHLVIFATNNRVVVSSESYIDMEESAHFKYKLSEAKGAYRKVKRKKLPITVDNVYNNWYHSYSKDIDMEITKRVVNNYETADTRNLSLKVYRMYRRDLFNEMTKSGYSIEEAINWVYEKER